MIFSNTSSAQPCPPGWNTSSFLTIIDLNGCRWQIDICYKCGYTMSYLQVFVLLISDWNP